MRELARRVVHGWLGPWVLGLALIVAAGCTSVVPPLVAGPFEGGATVLDHALAVTARRGYHAEEIDREAGTFIVAARTDPRVLVTFLVRCTADGWIAVIPSGDRVTEVANGYRLRGRTRDEYLSFTAALHREVTAMSRGDEDGR
jgi:hypothetical protein